MCIKPNEQGDMEVYTRTGFSSSRSNLVDNELDGLLRGRWDKLRIEQLGTPDVAVVDPKQQVVFLRLILPDDLQAEARKKLSSRAQQEFLPVVFELNLGSTTR